MKNNSYKQYNEAETRAFAKQIRINVLNMIYRAKASHLACCLSPADLIAHLYSYWLRINPSDALHPERDRFILSKGHGGAIVYAALGEQGFFPKEWLNTYCADDGKLPGHITHTNIPGVELSSGSLGHGLPVALGMALGAKERKSSYRTVVVLSDGEMNEGSNWEAFLMAPKLQIGNLIAIIDFNKLQGCGRVQDILPLEPLAEKLKSYNWAVREIDGHNHRQIHEALTSTPFIEDTPSVIIAHTTKGKGVSFMEDNILWHYKSPDAEHFSKAMQELSSSDAT